MSRKNPAPGKILIGRPLNVSRENPRRKRTVSGSSYPGFVIKKVKEFQDTFFCYLDDIIFLLLPVERNPKENKKIIIKSDSKKIAREFRRGKKTWTERRFPLRECTTTEMKISRVWNRTKGGGKNRSCLYAGYEPSNTATFEKAFFFFPSRRN